MLGSHIYDPGFLNCSHTLKKVLTDFYNIQMKSCMDIPCGNGRNMFLFASYFDKVVGIDINEEYLQNVNYVAPKYGLDSNSILTRKMDLLSEIPNDIQDFDFISTIHYYNYSLADGIIKQMKKGSLFYMETQNCAGGNFKELPLEKEVEILLQNIEIITYQRRHCQSTNSHAKSVSFKVLLRK
jgi:SAM-dependent methyltransferase